jgi:hypothetical protein
LFSVWVSGMKDDQMDGAESNRRAHHKFIFLFLWRVNASKSGFDTWNISRRNKLFLLFINLAMLLNPHDCFLCSQILSAKIGKRWSKILEHWRKQMSWQLDMQTRQTNYNFHFIFLLSRFTITFLGHVCILSMPIEKFQARCVST